MTEITLSYTMYRTDLPDADVAPAAASYPGPATDTATRTLQQ